MAITPARERVRGSASAVAREILLKADKVTVTFERLEDGKIRVTTTSWDDELQSSASRLVSSGSTSRWLISTPPGKTAKPE
jgi:hypothetical protein